MFLRLLWIETQFKFRTEVGNVENEGVQRDPPALMFMICLRDTLRGALEVGDRDLDVVDSLYGGRLI